MTADVESRATSTPSNLLLRRRRSSVEVYLSFIDEFRTSNGGWQIVVLGLLVAVGFGSVVGVIPQVATQRYAEELYGYGEDEPLCTEYFGDTRPDACVKGAEVAQSAASYASMSRNIMSLLCNSIAGSYSDSHGRRVVLLFALFLLTLSPAALLMIQVNKAINPTWYFVVDGATAMVSFMSISFAQISDIMPPRYRSASFGVFFGAFYAGIAIGPRAAVLLGHLQVSLFSVVVRVFALIFALVALPETLPDSVAARNKEKRREATPTSRGCSRIVKLMFRPLRELDILVRNETLILVTFATFLVKVVFSADVTLFFFYAENDLGLGDDDVATMLAAMGVVGVLIQAVFLKYFISILGEQGLLLTSFVSGIVHNLIYGLAKSKVMLAIGICLSQLTGTNGPLLSSLISRNVEANEQGRVQGAFFALSALAEAIGPVCLNYVYKNWHLFGPGTMFVVAAVLYAIGIIIVAFIPDHGGNDDEVEYEKVAPDESTPLVRK